MSPPNWLAGGFVLPASLFFGPLVSNPYAPRWVAVYLFAGIASLIGAFLVVRRKSLSLSVPDYIALVFIGWCAVTLEWSGDHKEGYFQLANLIALAAVYFYVSRVGRVGVSWAVATSLFCAVILARTMPPSNYGGFGNPNFLMEYLVIGLPIALLIRNTLIRILVVGAVLWHLTAHDTGYAKYVALGAAVLVALWYCRQRFVAAVIALGSVNLLLLANELGALPGSIFRPLRHRIELATNTVAMWLDAPFSGLGFGSFNYFYPRYQEAHLQWFPDLGTFLSPISMYVGAAHNEFLQTGAELGLVGFLLAAAFLGTLASRAERNQQTFGALISLAAACGVGLVGFPLQNPSSAVLVAVALGILGHSVRRYEIRVPRPVAWPAPVVGLSSLAFFLFLSSIYYKAQIEFSEARSALIGGYGAPAFVANVQAIQTFGWDWLPRHQLGLSMAYLALSDKKSVIHPEAADRIHEIALTASPWSPSTLVGRLNYLITSDRDEERSEEFESTLATLKQIASKQAAVWVTDAVYAARRNDHQRLINSVATGLEIGNPDDPARADILTMAKAIQEAGS